MSDTEDYGSDNAISIHTEHGPLHGQLTQVPEASGLVVLAHAGATPDAGNEALALTLHQAGFATLLIDLLAAQEARFADVHNNIPLLAKRLLDCLTLIKRQMQSGELPPLPIGLFGAGSASPVVVRVAALRDHDIAAVVCREGLIDLAGVLYLRTLESPLLVLLGENETTLLASNQRALQEITCPKALAIIPETENAVDSTADAVARKIINWFGAHCRAGKT